MPRRSPEVFSIEPIHRVTGLSVDLTDAQVTCIINSAERFGELLDAGSFKGNEQALSEAEVFFDLTRAMSQAQRASHRALRRRHDYA